MSDEYRRCFIISVVLRFTLIPSISVCTCLKSCYIWNENFFCPCSVHSTIPLVTWQLRIITLCRQTFPFQAWGKICSISDFKEPQTLLKPVLNKKINRGPKIQIIWLGSQSGIQIPELLVQSSFHYFRLSLWLIAPSSATSALGGFRDTL